jgi:hypothetical protein
MITLLLIICISLLDENRWQAVSTKKASCQGQEAAGQAEGAQEREALPISRPSTCHIRALASLTGLDLKVPFVK